MSFWIVIAIIVIVAFWAVALYNRLVGLRNQVQNGWRQIDVQLKRRHDLIPNLVTPCGAPWNSSATRSHR